MTPLPTSARLRQHRRCAALVLLAALLPALTPARADTNELISAWLATRTNVHTWSAGVLQTRTLKSLAHPLTAQGRVWFQAPDRFRWELGAPPRTIAIRQPDRLLLLYPLLKRAEVYPLGPNASGPWRDSLSLLEAGFPRDAAELRRQFQILSVESDGDQFSVALQPRSEAARRWMPRVEVTVATNDYALRATELWFADGSRMRNDFTNAAMNPLIEAASFDPPIPPDYKVAEPVAP